ncbi:RT0821/Lpp0805 family surface protein [Sedimenticola selenatireducens]|uniref:Glycine zipper 2TM domain-containing protein n=1 Tax=Sedimenticola selenatireducens TaxID=191960 RepID=A0A2N6CVJ0_9GAMM|nr:RT0821/Lpp0805 family surface protein [Sedimenticola selenatireducens]PLX61224.1 MAG: glycine zipper 2TM domain-containing protein [Sedimenticola selenatireducens]
MYSRWLIPLLILLFLLTGCENLSKRDTGTVLGGIAGGILGNQVGGGSGRTAAIIVGTLAGAYIGGSIGQQMDDNDRYRSQQALESNPINRTSSWRNPDSGNSYQVTPTRTYETTSGPCREYTTEAVIDGRTETVYGTACRQPDGTWQAAN